MSMLAKELGIDSQQLVIRLTEGGEYVKSGASTIEAPVVRQIREQFARSVATDAAVIKRSTRCE